MLTLTKLGGDGGTRTHRTSLLRRVSIPIPSHPHKQQSSFCVFNYKLNAFIFAEPTLKLGWPGRDRTRDPRINSALLYRLSYWPIKINYITNVIYCTWWVLMVTLHEPDFRSLRVTVLQTADRGNTHVLVPSRGNAPLSHDYQSCALLLS